MLVQDSLIVCTTQVAEYVECGIHVSLSRVLHVLAELRVRPSAKRERTVLLNILFYLQTHATRTGSDTGAFKPNCVLKPNCTCVCVCVCVWWGLSFGV